LLLNRFSFVLLHKLKDVVEESKGEKIVTFSIKNHFTLFINQKKNIAML